MEINGRDVEVCGCCEYCNNLYECGRNDLNMICCQRDFGDDDRECYRDCRDCMDDYRNCITDDCNPDYYEPDKISEIQNDCDIPF